MVRTLMNVPVVSLVWYLVIRESAAVDQALTGTNPILHVNSVTTIVWNAKLPVLILVQNVRSGRYSQQMVDVTVSKDILEPSESGINASLLISATQVVRDARSLVIQQPA